MVERNGTGQGGRLGFGSRELGVGSLDMGWMRWLISGCGSAKEGAVSGTEAWWWEGVRSRTGCAFYGR